ncbi:uncharacterized protein LOC107408445 [Ziziphus jujuba]|uniref:Uncharacterized protein LOC107408445 n=1 Tax=Ziziphus jujuba TaxID=326968 RepID=A0A6P3Z3Q4_ZIZJJ|nr:uncharacterized protein LOC107408445 [Ziziphus jujuba]XP_015871344.3 uncharacterized protein LOC107408445 [Ziziphus jujuba]
MDAVQVVSSATQIVSSMVSAVAALNEASRNLDEAPKRIQNLEDFVCQLENLSHRVKQKHVHKLHNPRLDHQIQSLNSLIQRLRPKISKARRSLSGNKFKNWAKVVRNSLSGDPLAKLGVSIQNDLNQWLEIQNSTMIVEKAIESTAQDVPLRLKIKTEHGFPISSKGSFVQKLLEQEDSHRVILIVGLSGMGKSSLARQVASDPPARFVGGAVELRFGQWCSRPACNGNKAEYQKRLAGKICKFLVMIGFWKKIKDEHNGGLEYVCVVLQEALYGKSILIVLDDVWEQDIVERFTKLYDNDCKYIVTTRNEAVYEITEAEKVELSKDDIREISKAVLLHHSLLSEEELPDVADGLLERCGHHPLTVAVMGKALRKETRGEKWEQAITNLSTYATCAEGPVSYVNEKEAENKLTIFGSFEFSLDAMPEDSRKLFIALAALSWEEPVPEACVEGIWSVLGQESLFSLVERKLVEGSLLMKMETEPLYLVHDMVSLYLGSKLKDSIEIILNQSTLEGTAGICPWLLIFGKENVKTLSEQKIVHFLSAEAKLAVITLKSIIQVMMASKSISELEASRASFSGILGPRISDLISTKSESVIAASAEAITNIFSNSDYSNYFPPLEATDIVSTMASILENCEDPTIQTSISIVLAKLAEFGSTETVNKVLEAIPFNRMADLLTPNAEEWHESMFTILMSLTKAGKSKAVEKMFASEIDKHLVKLLANGSDVAQNHAIVTLKTFYELGGRPENGSLRLTNLDLLPWQARLRLERYLKSDGNVPFSPVPQILEDLIHKLVDSDKKKMSEAAQDLIPIVEQAGEPIIRDKILKSPLIKRLSELLQYEHSEKNSMKSQSAFLLMKLACSGGEPCIRKFLEYDIVPELVKMMHCSIAEMQDTAYTALHQMLFGNGGVLILNQILQMHLVERMAQSLEGRSVKTREVNMNCLLDIVELGNKACLEHIFSLQVVEKLVKMEKSTGGTGEILVKFLRGMDKCKNLSVAERRVMKQQAIRKVKSGMRGHKFESKVVGAVDACVSEGSKGGSSSSGKHRK